MTEKKVQIKYKKISQNLKKKLVVIFLAKVLSIPKNLLHTVRNRIKKEAWKFFKGSFYFGSAEKNLYL